MVGNYQGNGFDMQNYIVSNCSSNNAACYFDHVRDARHARIGGFQVMAVAKCVSSLHQAGYVFGKVSLVE
jgi:hypothetical protein